MITEPIEQFTAQKPAPPPIVQLGSLPVSRLILGGNPMSGFSHQNQARDREMVEYFTVTRIKDLLRQAEDLGINTLISRVDRHIMRMLLEYWSEGGKIKWMAQTAFEFPNLSGCVAQAISNGASAVYIHGGQMDYFYSNNKLDVVGPAIEQIHAAGLPAGVAAHIPKVHQWANDNLPIDFHMCSYYNPTPRDRQAGHVAGAEETFDDADRDAMLAVIPELKKPAIHYKIFAAGRKDPLEAFELSARHLRPGDAMCIGVFPKDKQDMLVEDLQLFHKVLAGR